jgi:hypothetical protein
MCGYLMLQNSRLFSFINIKMQRASLGENCLVYSGKRSLLYTLVFT